MSVPVSPRAHRLGTDRRDVRLAIGVALVIGSVLLGSRVFAAADHRVQLLSARDSLAAGTTLTEADVVVVDVAVDSASSYLDPSAGIDGRVLTRDVGAGELIAASALGDSVRTDRRFVTVPVDPLHAPPALARGERVDVYVSPKDGTSVGGGSVTVLPTLVLAGALVADPGSADASGASSQIGVVLDVADSDAGQAVAAARGGDVDLVRVGGGGS
ncbi:MAG: SAF domain-containing protein [Actinomycetes bacterium]